MPFHNRILAALAAFACITAPAAAQQDTGMMAHDTAMMDHGTAMDDKMDGGEMMDPDSTGGTVMHGDRVFMGASGEKAMGDYEVVENGGQRQLKLNDGFAVADGRDLYLVLATGNAADEESLFLGKLERRSGAQTYNLPVGKDLSGYTTLLVWSKKDQRAVASAEWYAESGHAMEHM